MPDLAPLSLGPLVLNGERALVALAVLAAVVVADIQGRRRGRSADWSWSAVAIGLLAARVGWIVAHPQAYLARPLDVFYVWQGGFLGWAGVAAALARRQAGAPEQQSVAQRLGDDELVPLFLGESHQHRTVGEHRPRVWQRPG